MRYLVLAVAVLLSGCGNLNRAAANLTGNSSSCVGGVEYLQFPSGVTVAYNPDGTVKTCQ